MLRLAHPFLHSYMSDKSQEELREEVADSIPDDVTLFESDGKIYGTGPHGEFQVKPMRGSDEPVEDRCGWPVKYHMERYGQVRYCTMMPEKTFVDDGSDYCRHHKAAEQLMERAHELFKHGYFATNYINFAEKLDAAKFLFAVEMVGGLFEMSDHEFDLTTEERIIDASESQLIDQDNVGVELPIPQNDSLSVQANELWTAALKEVMQQNMQEAIFTEGMEKATVEATEGMEGQITDTLYGADEHHLHLPLSRVAKDIKEHLKNGGVSLDDDDGGIVTFQRNDYTLDVEPEEIESDATEDSSEVAGDFAEYLESDEAAEIEVE